MDRWLKSRNSINREIYPENFRCQLFLWPLPVISDIPPKVDAASATHFLLLCPPENSKGKGTMSRGSLPGLTGKWQDWVKTGRWPRCPVSGISLPRVTGFKKVLAFSTSWRDTCDIKCASWGAVKTCGGVHPSTVAAPPPCIHHVSPHPGEEPASPGLRQVPGPALQQLPCLGLMPGCLACSPPDSHIPGSEPRAGSEKKCCPFFLIK